MFCSKCGKKIPDGSNKCPACNNIVNSSKKIETDSIKKAGKKFANAFGKLLAHDSPKEKTPKEAPYSMYGFRAFCEQLANNYKEIERLLGEGIECIKDDIFGVSKAKYLNNITTQSIKMLVESYQAIKFSLPTSFDNEETREKYETFYNQLFTEHCAYLKDRIKHDWEFGIYTAVSYLLISLERITEEEEAYLPAIEAIKEVILESGKNTSYLSFVSYGNVEFALDNPKEMERLDKSADRLLNKLFEQRNHWPDNHTGYYEGIANNFNADFILTASELMWYYAKKRPFNAECFDAARRLYTSFKPRCPRSAIDAIERSYFNEQQRRNLLSHLSSMYTDSSAKYPIDEILANIYAKNQIGGLGTVKAELEDFYSNLNEMIEANQTEKCYLLASGLAWMELYPIEHEVLKRIVAANISLPEELQERLGFLERGGDFNVQIYSIPKTEALMFDSSSTDWNAKDYDLFFRQLQMKDIDLNYSLAVHQWSKAVPLTSGQKFNPDKLHNELLQMVEDYDGEVILQITDAKAINLNNLEYNEAALFKFNSTRNRCVNILFTYEKFGRNLNLTAQTLFTPEASLPADELKKYALAILDNRYVDSFLESVLQAVDNTIAVKQAVYDDAQQDASEWKVFE